MAKLNVPTESQKAWLASGGSEEALEYLGNVVGKMAQEASNAGLLSKEANEEDAPVLTDDEVVAADVVVEPVAESIPVVEPVVQAAETAPTADVVKTMEAAIGNAIVDAIKQYHTDIVVPLIDELKKSLTVEKPVVKAMRDDALFASDFLPPSAVSSLLKQRFQFTDDGAKTLTKEEVEKGAIVAKNLESDAKSDLFADI